MLVAEGVHKLVQDGVGLLEVVVVGAGVRAGQAAHGGVEGDVVDPGVGAMEPFTTRRPCE
ncbi:hypothetical protein [Nonomuraea sp. NPDC049684]|uniref:hypothetical protein n=1 Tax=Nonomuraea sp. NPDC049684 TaxID=3364356 RepID=UPI0037B7D6EA